ncbi:MAG: hypothetical protein HC778_04550 [Chamaesiphon sp. CSU_1_12]|nr:hypothetical protein [Chamaesiphon sp. CSU_1_12]
MSRRWTRDLLGGVRVENILIESINDPFVVNPATGAPINRETLIKHFRGELDMGIAKANVAIAQRDIIFDATGRLQNMWPIGGDMTDQLLAEIQKAARAK